MSQAIVASYGEFIPGHTFTHFGSFIILIQVKTGKATQMRPE